MGVAGGEVGVAAGGEGVGDWLAGFFEFEIAGEDVDEALGGALDEFAVGLEFEGHLGEGGTDGGRDVDDGKASGEAGEGRADEGVGRLQEVGGVVLAAGMAEVVHMERV